jgi:uncharacterized protein (TIGR03086 family)
MTVDETAEEAPEEPGDQPGALSPAEEFRLVAGGFAERVDGAAPDAWDSPSPVEGWAARDVVRHLVEWFPPFLAHGSNVQIKVWQSVDEDPVGAWHSLQDQVQALLDDPATGSKVLSDPHVGEVPLDIAVSRFFTGDVFLHTWDLARATGQDETLDPERCRVMLAGMEPMDELLRASGHYGPKVDVSQDSDVQTKLLAFIGRDPR